MTTPKPTPIRRDDPEEVWHEVRCPRCNRHIVDLVAGSKARKTSPSCKALVIRAIPESKAA